MPSQAAANGNGNGNGHAPHPRGNGTPAAPGWQCSPKQRELIRSIIAENALTDDRVDGLARQRFGVGLAQLNKLQASGLIDELLESFGGRGKPRNGSGNGSGNGNTAATQGNGGAR